MNSYIGIDFGGTTIKAGVVKGGKIIKILSADTQAAVGGQVTLNVLIGIIEELFSSSISAIGIGVPSVVDRESGVVYDVHNVNNWDCVPLKEILETKFSVPVIVDNDANCFALGERYFGKGQSFEHFVGITLGTGVGGGIIQSGSLLKDANCGSGEFGELPYRDSILEDYCGSRFFTQRHNTTGLHLSTLAKQGDCNALKLWGEYGTHLASLVKIITLTVDPQAIIFGGSIAKSFDLFAPTMRAEMQKFLFSKSICRLTIDYSELDNSAILGAAALCI